MKDSDNIIGHNMLTAEAPAKENIESSPRFHIDENRLYYSLELENDSTGAILETQALEQGFRRQDNRHITIIGGETKRIIKRSLEKFSEVKRGEILGEIKRILESLSWKFEPKDIYKIQKQDYFNDPDILENRESYINIVDMPDIEVFYKRIGSLLGVDLPLQVTHITLYTKGEPQITKYYGTPISSIEDFNAMNPQKIVIDANHHA